MDATAASRFEHHAGRTRRAAWIAAAAAVTMITACAAPPERESGAREIGLAAFSVNARPATRDASSEAPRDASSEAPQSAATSPRSDDTSAPAAPPLAARGPRAVDDDGDADADTGRDPLPPAAPRTTARRLEPGERVIIDGMVGQVNGYPIFADAFLEPIADRLIALRDQVPVDAYSSQAARIVGAELQQVVLNALFLAEAEADLTLDERKGIQAWVQELGSRVISGYQGSEERARREIYETEGKSFEAHMQALRDQELIKQLVQQRIARRIIVSRSDIEREYRRRIDEFRPPPRITIARISLSTTDTIRIDEVNRRLGQGETLVAIAEAIGQGAGAAWQTFEVPDGDLGQVDIASETLKSHLAGLHEEGDVAGPFEIRGFTWWLGIASIEQEPQLDIYDDLLQRRLAAHIRAARVSEEQERYIASLLDKGIYDELDEMGQRLLLIALRRYGP